MTDLLPSTREAIDRSPSAPHRSGRTDEAQRERVVLDTSVLIADPTCVLEFHEVGVVIPLTVVEELDGLKSRPDDVGRAARTALRTLEELRVEHGGSLADPVPTGNGDATIQIEINNIRKHTVTHTHTHIKLGERERYSYCHHPSKQQTHTHTYTRTNKKNETSRIKSTCP